MKELHSLKNRQNEHISVKLSESSSPSLAVFYQS